MSIDEAIKLYESNAEYERTHGRLQGCLNFRQLAEWLTDYKRLKERESYKDEYIKVPKKALKYVTKGMVAYNFEWLREHFDIERLVVCGEQEPCGDAISRQAVNEIINDIRDCISVEGYWALLERLKKLSPVNPQIKTRHWRHYEGMLTCSECGEEFYDDIMEYCGDDVPAYCPNCGAKMVEPQESEDKE